MSDEALRGGETSASVDLLHSATSTNSSQHEHHHHQQQQQQQQLCRGRHLCHQLDGGGRYEPSSPRVDDARGGGGAHADMEAGHGHRCCCDAAVPADHATDDNNYLHR